MKKNLYYAIGLMSGTSVDGIDLCYVSFNLSSKWEYDILICETIDYSDDWVESLKNAIYLDTESLSSLDIRYSIFLSNIISDFIARNKINKLDFISSHGHTVNHQPDEGYTYQIGNLIEITTYLESPIICDFRVQDVKLGGQGAPLVPIGDRLLFSEFQFCVNIGGFANVSYEQKGERIAFDICPANLVLNKYACELGFTFDRNGTNSERGNFHIELYDELNKQDYYLEKPPKSLGLEWVETNIFPLLKSFKLSPEDVLRTYVEHIAFQIASSTNYYNNVKILVTGGGTFNSYLIKRIRKYSKNELIIPNENIISYKEALIFAFLGVLKLRNEDNCLQSVTGATKDHSSGVIYNLK